MSDLSFIMDDMVWSFSRINSFNTCKYEWYQKYINCEYGDTSAFAQYGSFMHKILEMYAKGELSLFDLSSYYTEHYEEEVQLPFPYNQYVDLGEQYYNKGLEYLENIDWDIDKYEVLGVEQEVSFKVGKYPCVGFIDLLLRDKETKEITLIDHKSASIKFNKNGSVSKKDADHFQEFKRQEYLYCKAVKERYGEFPKKLKWNLFKEQSWVEINFDKNEYEEAVQWAENTINEIREETEWKPNPGRYYCRILCSHRAECEFNNPSEEEDSEE